MNQFTELAERVTTHREAILALVVRATPDTFMALSQALPGFYVADGPCDKYSLSLEASTALQDPRLEAVLLAEMKSYRSHRAGDDLPYRLAEYYNHDPAKLLPFLQNDTSGCGEIYYSRWSNHSRWRLILPLLTNIH